MMRWVRYSCATDAARKDELVRLECGQGAEVGKGKAQSS